MLFIHEGENTIFSITYHPEKTSLPLLHVLKQRMEECDNIHLFIQVLLLRLILIRIIGTKFLYRLPEYCRACIRKKQISLKDFFYLDFFSQTFTSHGAAGG